MMRCITAHEDELVVGGTSETADVVVSVSRSLEKIEAAVSKEIDGLESTDVYAGSEIEFHKLTSLERILTGDGIWILRITWEGLLVALETWADYERGRFGEEGWVTSVVHVMVTPDDRVDRFEGYGGGSELICNIRGYVHHSLGELNLSQNGRWLLVLPGLHEAEVIQDLLAQFLVLDQEAVAWDVEQVVAGDLFLDNVLCRDSRTASMDQRDADSRAFRGREGKLGWRHDCE